MFHYINLIIPFAVLMPNLIYIGFPPRNLPDVKKNHTILILKSAEGIGRFGVIVLPIFSSIHKEEQYEFLSLVGMTVFLLLYYFGWMRYFRGKREYKLLYSPMFGIPVPLAVFPTLYFMSASFVLHSPLLFLSNLILAIGHIPISLKSKWRD